MRFLLFLLLLFPAGAAGSSRTPLYKVVFVLDGDTFAATDGNVTFRVRIAGLDAPEKGQPFGDEARKRLKDLLEGKRVVLQPLKKGWDRYGRVLAHVFFQKDDVALRMIREGLAFYYRPFCRDWPADKKKYNFDPRPYVAAEKEARQRGGNIWALKAPRLPCLYRRSFSGAGSRSFLVTH